MAVAVTVVVLLGVFCSLTSVLPACWSPRSLPLAEETEGEGCLATSRVSSLSKDFIFFFLSLRKKPQAVVFNEAAGCTLLQVLSISGSVDGQSTKKLQWVIDVGGQQVNKCSPATQTSVLSLKRIKSWGNFMHLPCSCQCEVPKLPPKSVVKDFTRVRISCMSWLHKVVLVRIGVGVQSPAPSQWWNPVVDVGKRPAPSIDYFCFLVGIILWLVWSDMMEWVCKETWCAETLAKL